MSIFKIYIGSGGGRGKPWNTSSRCTSSRLHAIVHVYYSIAQIHHKCATTAKLHKSTQNVQFVVWLLKIAQKRLKCAVLRNCTKRLKVCSFGLTLPFLDIPIFAQTIPKCAIKLITLFHISGRSLTTELCILLVGYLVYYVFLRTFAP